MRLIDADALLAAFEKDISEQTKHMELLKSVGDMKHYYDISKVQIGMVSCRRMLENAPIIIDAVPVVRCKDCIHSTSQVSDDEDNYYCNAMRRCMHSLDFCSYAERKES